jgi:transposase
MNNPHQNARLTVHSREQIVARVASGQSASEVAAAFAVSIRTVRKWLARFRTGGGAALSNRASAPARVSRRLPAETVALIVHLRRSLRLTGAAIAAKLGLARATVARWLRREGIGQLVQIDPPEPVRRYQRERPGELIHLDIKKLGRFDRPGHRATGMRRTRNRGAGWDFVHVAVDDATRLSYVEVLDDERKETTTGFLLRALRWFRNQGIHAERVMTDNGAAYRSRRFAKALRWLGIRHIFTSATSSQGPIRPRRTVRQKGSSKPSCANGPTASHTPPPQPETQTCRGGLTGSTKQDHTQHSTASHPFQR